MSRFFTIGFLLLACLTQTSAYAMNLGLRSAMWGISHANRKNIVVEPEEIYVSFEACGGEFASGSIITQKCEDVYTEFPVVTREGYSFLGWSSGVTNGSPFAVEGSNVIESKDHILFARWDFDESVMPGGESIFAWEDISEDTIKVTGFKNKAQKVSDLYIPDTINGKAVVEIGMGAFANSKSGMRRLVMPVFCKKIGDRAFMGTSSLKEVKFVDIKEWLDPIKDATLSIGAYAFSGAGFSAVTLPKCVGSLGNYAFANCKDLKCMTILGKPEIGLMPLRRSGLNVGGVTVHLDPELASDVEYMAKLKQGCENVFVRADAIITKMMLSSMALTANEVEISVSVEKAAQWGEFDIGRIKVIYWEELNSEPEILIPSSVVKNKDGSYLIKVFLDNGQSGFFRVIAE